MSSIKVSKASKGFLLDEQKCQGKRVVIWNKRCVEVVCVYVSPSLCLPVFFFPRSPSEARALVRENNWMGLPHKIHSETSSGIRMRNCPAHWIESIWSITRSLSRGFPFCLWPGLRVPLDKCVRGLHVRAPYLRLGCSFLSQSEEQ